MNLKNHASTYVKSKKKAPKKVGAFLGAIITFDFNSVSFYPEHISF
jgi:hypothetical protein